MDYEYIVEVRDFIRDVLIERSEFSDSNTAYHHFRTLDDQYHNSDHITITLIEPD